ncbi:hypothetical protein Q4F19_13375 [Sphingomonas sp. BIUV-7]|uniref:DUF5983 domain-containing protein n=1 Tax=Sphingomonas natans TaxID=3063330 RepID=A0ABT8YC21_9SPHN|nr:hypothetical protein [Sphingomonas sp. BIUV-7]MDO6415378.1 hypothetical protein [Sphingomonas sp. BIUV-7]
MDMPTPASRTFFDVVAIYASDGERFAREQLRIDVADHISPYAAARACAERRAYADPRIPGLAIFLVVTPVAGPNARSGLRNAASALACNVGCYLVLSTAHIRCSTAQMLDHWAQLYAHQQPLAVARMGFGWLISTCIVSERMAQSLPEEIPAILAFGRAQGCDHVLLDCDGREERRLPVYPW